MRTPRFPLLILLALLWLVSPSVLHAGEQTGAAVWTRFIDKPLAIVLSGRFYDPQTDHVADRRRTCESPKDIDAIVHALTSASLQRLPDAEAAPYFDKSTSFSTLTSLEIQFQYADKPDREVFLLGGWTLIFDKMVFNSDRDVIAAIWPLVK